MYSQLRTYVIAKLVGMIIIAIISPLLSIHLGDKFYTAFFTVRVDVVRYETIDE